MIKKILNKSTCADCKTCCIFDCYDVWETPLFDKETADVVKLTVPTAEFAPKGNGFVLDFGKMSAYDLVKCPALSDSGCILGDKKPFDCRIWPFRIMEHDGQRIIAVSSLCTAVFEQSHDKLKDFLKNGLAAEIFAYGEKYPEAIHPLYDNYTILLTESDIK
ncbi:MAG: hypothetical protein IKJ87_09210 [Ruminococcus sp.]|nr:hypothetical protein [Ruminococcus sp.]